MPLAIEDVPRPVHDPMIPDQLASSVLLLASLRQSGLLGRLGGALRVSRRGGYTGLPLVMFALTFLAASGRGGIRRFTTRFKRPLRRVAAVAGVRAFPTQGSVSRALRGLTTEQVHEFTEAALTDVPGLPELLRHPAVAHLDAYGDPWHVLDIDPTVEAHRLRDLVAGEAYPDGTRLAPGVPGYTGQKRGELRVRHIPILHAGAGVWLAYRHAVENVHLSEFIQPLVAHARTEVVRAGIEPARVIIRGDGEFGAAGVALAIVEQGVGLVTRISRYSLLDRPEVAAGLSTATWSAVRTSTGKPREAAELGMVVLHPSERAADAGADPVTLRVVVVRKPRKGEARHGVLRDGYQLELFGTTLPPDRWPAADLVELYCGRATIENCFAQEDRQFGLERMFCYHGPGQAWMIAVGLFLWNFMTCAGFLQNPPSIDRPSAPKRDVRTPSASVVTEATHALALAKASAEEARAEQAQRQFEATQTLDDAHDKVPPENLTGPTGDQLKTRPINTASAPRDPFPGMPAQGRRALADGLRTAFADLVRRPGWSLDLDLAIIECPNDKRLFPFSVAKPCASRPKSQIMVRTDVGACDGCPIRASCFSSTRPNQYKQLARAVDLETAETVRLLIKEHPPVRRMPLAKPQRKRRQRRRHSVSPSKGPSRTATPLITPIVPTVPGPLLSLRPTFLPAAARNAYLDEQLSLRVEIRIAAAPQTAPSHPFTAPAHGRARLRMTWEQRDAKWHCNARVRLIRHVPIFGRRSSKNPAITGLRTN